MAVGARLGAPRWAGGKSEGIRCATPELRATRSLVDELAADVVGGFASLGLTDARRPMERSRREIVRQRGAGLGDGGYDVLQALDVKAPLLGTAGRDHAASDGFVPAQFQKLSR